MLKMKKKINSINNNPNSRASVANASLNSQWELSAFV